jgi:hypothetical protein
VIFISYPRERSDDAEQWRRELCARGRSAFVCHTDAKQDNPAFESLRRPAQRELLAGRIGGAEAMLVLWDRNYGRAAWCAWELQSAVGTAGKRVFLANLDGSLVPRELQARVEVIHSARQLHDRLAEQSVVEAVATPLDNVALYPAASLLESRFAPRFESRTRGARELATMLGWLALSIAMQLLIYYGAAPWMTSDVRAHLWALVTAINIAMTLLCAFALSTWAATTTGVLGLGLALAVMTVGVAWRGEPDQETVTIGASAMGTFHVALVMLLRDRLLGMRPGQPAPHTPTPWTSARWGHASATLGVVVLGALLAIGLRSLDAAIELARRIRDGEVPPDEYLKAVSTLYEVPVRLGLLVGFLAGIALGAAAYGRALRNYRETSPVRIPVAALWALLTCALATKLGHATGVWIQNNVVAAISEWGGSYAGAQVGVLLAAGLVLPVAAGNGRMSIRSERWWGMVGTLTVIAIITLKIRSFPFAAHRDGVPREIMTGALLGFAPITLLRAVLWLSIPLTTPSTRDGGGVSGTPS